MQLGMDCWGYRFVMAGPDYDSTYGVRIVYSRQTNVSISRNSAAPTHLPNADPATFLEFPLHRNEIVYLKSSAPIQVAMLWPTEVKIVIKGRTCLIIRRRENTFRSTSWFFPSIEVGLRLNNNFLEFSDKVLRLQEGMFVRRTAIIIKDVANIDGYRLDHVADPGVQSQYERPVSVSVPFSDNTTEYDTTASVLYENNKKLSHRDDHQLGDDYALYQQEQRSMMSEQAESMGQSEHVEEMEMIEYESSIH